MEAYITTKQHRASFLNLPYEIRLNIYSYLFDNNHFTIWDKVEEGYHELAYRFERAILCTCKQIYKEAKFLLLSTTKVRLIDTYGNHAFKISLLHKLLPQCVLESATTLECNVQVFYHPVPLEAFPSLKVLHLRERQDIDDIDDVPIYQSRLLMVPVHITSIDEMHRFYAGGFDRVIVSNLSGTFQQGRVFSMVFRTSPAFSERKFRIQITTRGSLVGAVASKMWDSGSAIFQREITFDYDTSEILNSRTVYVD